MLGQNWKREVSCRLDDEVKLTIALATPWLFSNQALDLDQARVKRLINAYIQSLGSVVVVYFNNRADNKGTFFDSLKSSTGTSSGIIPTGSSVC